jgi:hypothetical protein
MTPFIQSLQKIRDLPQSEQSQVLAKYRLMCICPVCPNHNTCAMSKYEWFYCMTGKSFLCIDFERTCICETCPVAKELGISQSFFCTRGAETAQRYEHSVWGTKIP